LSNDYLNLDENKLKVFFNKCSLGSLAKTLTAVNLGGSSLEKDEVKICPKGEERESGKNVILYSLPFSHKKHGEKAQFLFLMKKASSSVSHATLELMILLPQPLKCWDDRHVTPR
jgi:hypothetical protein